MNRTTLITLGISIVLLLASGLVYAITFNAVSKEQEESFLLAEEIGAALDKEARINRAERTLLSIQTQEQMVYERLVSEETVVDFLERLESIEDLTGVEIEIVSVAADEEKDAFVLNLTIDGAFKRVMETLGAIEKLPVFIAVERGSIETILREGESTGEWSASASYIVHRK